MTRRINAAGLSHIMQWEGKRLSAYKDVAGIWTIGFGHTDAAGPPKVTPGMSITGKQAEEILRADIAKFEARVERLVKVPLTDNQFAALVSFDFNTGALHKSTLLKKLNAGDYASVPAELMKWVNAGGKKVQGLANRRASEAGLWAKGEFVSSNTVEAKPVAAPIMTKENVSWGAGILSTLGFANAAPGPMQYALAAILLISFAVGLFFFIRSRVRPE